VVTSADGEGAGRSLGRYILFEAIARGGMATVHFGRLSGPVGFSRTVAIKRLHPHLSTDPEFVTMFLDEARLAARIRHPNVVATLDVVTVEGEVYIVMDYVQGESLARLWRAVRMRGERMPTRYTLASVAGALHGLHAAHEVTDETGQLLGIVHRDVSPQNILVGTDGVSRVLDFGVAKAAGRMQETGDSGSLKGKIAYMAPEHISGNGVTRRTDVYASAVVLWELLAGERLFDGESDAQRAAKILSCITGQAIPPPSRYNPEVNSGLDDIVMRALAWPPESRFATAKEMALAIEQNGGLVPATELGDWVTSLAGPALAERAGRLNAIEASGARVETSKGGKPFPISLGEVVAESDQTITGAPASMPSGVSTAAVVSPRQPRRRSGLLIALIGFVGAVVAVMGWRLTRVPAADLRPLPAGSPAGSATLVASLAPSSITPVASAPATIAVAPSSPASSSPASPSPSTHSVKPPRPRASAPTTKPHDDCDPPYTIDAENHKIYKRNCIK
jgi:serine/threonine-protein kinase